MWSKTAAAVEAVVLATAIAVAPPNIKEKITHFTWWGITSLLIFDITIATNAHTAYTKIYFMAATIAFTIMFGVIAMSAMECTILKETVNEIGSVEYIIGNTAIHYYPVTRIIASPPPTKPPQVAQIIATVSLFVTYARINKAPDVYGCTIEEYAVVIAGAAGAIAAYFLEAAAYKYYKFST